MKGLIIKSPWVEMILDGLKPWEIRGSYSHVRGKVALIRSGSKSVVGYANMTGCLGPFTKEEFAKYQGKHHAVGFTKYKKIYAWVLEDVEKLETPIPYKHPQGAIIWVNL